VREQNEEMEALVGMYDSVIILDDLEDVGCPHGHSLRVFQTKDLENASMNTYLVFGGRLLLTLRDEEAVDEIEARGWRLHDDEAILEKRFGVRQVAQPRTLRVHTSCSQCEPILVRTEPGTFRGDIVAEHRLWVDLMLTFRPGEPVQVQLTSGTRSDMKADLIRRGCVVLAEDEPLAIAHRELTRVMSGRERRYYW
jgi:hypothetical protein